MAEEKKVETQETDAVPDMEGQLLDMEEAIALVKTTRPTFYRWLRAGKVKGTKVGRQWRFRREDIERFIAGQGPTVSLRADIAPLLEGLAEKLRHSGLGEAPPEAQSPTEQAVWLMSALAYALEASDGHVHARTEREAVFRLRIDGLLHPMAAFDKRLLPALVEQWKVTSGADPRQTLLPQDGRSAKTIAGAALDIRTHFTPAALGEAVTFRVLRSDQVRDLGLDYLPLPPEEAERMRSWIRGGPGMFIASGPTGSGKTTTMLSMLAELNQPDRKVMTVEDPVELLLPGAVQIPVNPQAGLTFVKGLISVFRSDPDVIMLGEVRDAEALQILCKACMSGHQCLTQMHCTDAAGALIRVRELVQDPIMIRSAVRLVAAQRLLRRLCDHCAVEAEPPAELMEKLEQAAGAGGLDWARLPERFREPKGCPQCGGFGYRGRTMVIETIDVNEPILDALFDRADADTLSSLAVEQGTVTLAARGACLAAEGVTSAEEVSRVLL